MERTKNQGFNYCTWAKTLVAIPALPLVAILATLPFHSPIAQSVAAVIAVVFTLAGAVWVDNLPFLKRTFRTCRAHKRAGNK